MHDMSQEPDKPKRGPGRPRTRPAKPVGIRCEFSPEEHARASAAAEAEGKPLGTFAREAVVEAAEKVLKRKGPK